MIRMIVALDKKRGIAKHGDQPWMLKADFKHFAELTKQHGGTIVMGRTTYEVIGRALPGRTNYVLSKSDQPLTENIIWIKNLDQISAKDIWIIGGSAVYQDAMPIADELYITEINADFNCDQFFPDYSDWHIAAVSDTQHENDLEFRYCTYKRVK